jgi:hypothetical protein
VGARRPGRRASSCAPPGRNSNQSTHCFQAELGR